MNIDELIKKVKFEKLMELSEKLGKETYEIGDDYTFHTHFHTPKPSAVDIQTTNKLGKDKLLIGVVPENKVYSYDMRQINTASPTLFNEPEPETKKDSGSGAGLVALGIAGLLALLFLGNRGQNSSALDSYGGIPVSKGQKFSTDANGVLLQTNSLNIPVSDGENPNVGSGSWDYVFKNITPKGANFGNAKKPFFISDGSYYLGADSSQPYMSQGGYVDNTNLAYVGATLEGLGQPSYSFKNGPPLI